MKILATALEYMLFRAILNRDTNVTNVNNCQQYVKDKFDIKVMPVNKSNSTTTITNTVNVSGGQINFKA